MKTRAKTGGREKGTPNKVTENIRKVFSNAIENYLSTTFEKDLKVLKPEQRIKIYLALSEFIIPKMQRIETNSMENEYKIKSYIIGCAAEVRDKLPANKKEIINEVYI